MKTYHLYHAESKQAEIKLKYLETQKLKVEQHAGKGTLSRKFKSFEKQTEKVSHSVKWDCRDAIFPHFSGIPDFHKSKLSMKNL